MTTSKRRPSNCLNLESLERRDLLTIFPTLVMQTNAGSIEMELYDDTAPQTVANFLNYVSRGDYENAIFHRIAPNFVVQGGGFRSDNETLCDCTVAQFDPNTLQASDFNEIPTDPPVVNEFNRSNIRATVAMAKLGGDPDSATNQFFFNLVDNSQNLNNQNGGFTVFAGVTDMTLVDALGTGPAVNLSGIFPRTSRLSAISAAAVIEDPATPQVDIVRMQSFTGTAVIDGNVYLDLNRNGQMDSGEGGLGGVTVFLDSNNDGFPQESEPFTTTDDLGYYGFRVNPGTHQVRVTPFGDYDSTSVSGEPQAQATTEMWRRSSNDFGFQYVGTSWHNERSATNVDDINGTAPLDALLVINELTSREFSDAETGELIPLTSPPITPRFLDVDDSMSVEPLDALRVINALEVVEEAPLSLRVGSDDNMAPPNSSPAALPAEPWHAPAVTWGDRGEDDDARLAAIEAIFASG